jgi:hypothetical protein
MDVEQIGHNKRVILHLSRDIKGLLVRRKNKWDGEGIKFHFG